MYSSTNPPPSPGIQRVGHEQKSFLSRGAPSQPNSTKDTPLSASESSSLNNEKQDYTTTVTAAPEPTSYHWTPMGFLNDELDGAHTSIYLLVSFFTSGLIDSVVFNAWSCFVGMQTGNTIFAALGLSGQPRIVHPNAYLKSLTSILAFCAGTLFFSAFHRLPCWSDPNPAPSRRRFILVCSFSLQTVFILIVATLVKVGVVSNRPSVAGAFSSGNHLSNLTTPAGDDNYKDLIAVGLLAFQSAGPVFFSRVVGVIELPTIVLSTLYCDFVADLYRLPQSLRTKTSWYTFFLNDERRQFKRLGSILMLFLGGMVGGLMFRSKVGMIGAFWLAAGLKGMLVLGWVLWPSERREEEEGDV